MFKYGKRGGYMAIALLVLAVVPIVVTLVCLPQMAESVPMRFNAAGEVTRWGDRLEILIFPVLGLLLGGATYVSGRRQADTLDIESPAAARLTFERFMRNGIVTGVILAVVSIYFVVAALTGVGLPF